MAITASDRAAAQLVAAEAVMDTETKDHSSRELIGKIAENGSGKMASLLQEAFEQVEEEEDEHLYHTMGRARERWIEALGMPAVLPPPPRSRRA